MQNRKEEIHTFSLEEENKNLKKENKELKERIEALKELYQYD